MSDRDEQLKRAVAAATYGIHSPGVRVREFAGTGGGSPEGVFDALDLLALASPAEPYRMPNGKPVWVHPLNSLEVVWINGQAALDSQAQRPRTDEERDLWFQHRAYAYQVQCACRVGPESDARPVFSPAHVDAIQSNLPIGVVRGIAAQSDRLGASGNSQYQGALDFFGAARTWAETWLSRSSADWPGSMRAALEGFARCVSSIEQRGSWGSEDVATLRELTEEANRGNAE